MVRPSVVLPVGRLVCNAFALGATYGRISDLVSNAATCAYVRLKRGKRMTFLKSSKGRIYVKYMSSPSKKNGRVGGIKGGDNIKRESQKRLKQK